MGLRLCGHIKLSLELKEEGTEIARLLAAAYECWAPDMRILFVEFNHLYFCMDCELFLTELLIPNRKPLTTQVCD